MSGLLRGLPPASFSCPWALFLGLLSLQPALPTLPPAGGVGGRTFCWIVPERVSLPPSKREPFLRGQMRLSPTSSPPKLSCPWPAGLRFCWSRSGWLHWFACAGKSSQGVGEGRLGAPFLSFSCCKRPSLACLSLCTGWLSCSPEPHKDNRSGSVSANPGPPYTPICRGSQSGVRFHEAARSSSRSAKPFFCEN